MGIYWGVDFGAKVNPKPQTQELVFRGAFLQGLVGLRASSLGFRAGYELRFRALCTLSL